MVGWGDLGSRTGSRTAPSGGFPCGFNIVGRLWPLHEAGHAVGLLGKWVCAGTGPIEQWV